jgi:hypothetical protein
MLPCASRKALRHQDRWRVADMLTEQPDLTSKDARRDMELWRHLFAPDEIVRVGRFYRAACEAEAAEWCWGNTWAGGIVEGTVALCWPSPALLRGATCEDTMSRHEACEAVIGRLRTAGIGIVLIVDDGDGSLECWIDPGPGGYPVASRSRGRCPGGINSRTGLLHRVVSAERIYRAQERREKERLHRGGDLVSVRSPLEQKSKMDAKTVQTNLNKLLWKHGL